MASVRLPRFKRAPDVAPLELTERDREIIRLIYRHRFLRSSHVTSLLGGSAQSLLRRLQLLYHHGYLERPRAQLDYFRKGGSHEMAYGLGNKGGTLLRQELGETFREFRCNEKNQSVGQVFLDHALLVSEIMVAIELACRRYPQVRLIIDEALNFKGDHHPLHHPLYWRAFVSPNLSLGVIPDRVFALEFEKPEGHKERILFFLEADRGTMPVIRSDLKLSSMYRKLLAYEATWTGNLHRTQFGFNRFRVLTVTKSKARVKSLTKACSKLERGHGLFLFADRSVLETPNLLSAQIWQTGRQGEPGSLLN